VLPALADPLARLHAATSADTRWEAAGDALGAYGGAWITAASAPRAALQPVALRTSVPDGLMRDYIGAGLPRSDRWLQHCATSPAIDCADLTGPRARDAGALDPALAAILADHGVTFVALVPAGTHERVEALVVYATSRDGATDLRRAAAGPELPALAALLAAFRIADAGPVPNGAAYRFGDLLSPRERETLLWLASGLRTAEIAHRMGIEPVTVGVHLAGARRKLRARTREQALAIALRDGHIAP
jgi:DNA-binding CsgD family transcriptional regulator